MAASWWLHHVEQSLKHQVWWSCNVLAASRWWFCQMSWQGTAPQWSYWPQCSHWQGQWIKPRGCLWYFSLWTRMSYKQKVCFHLSFLLLFFLQSYFIVIKVVSILHCSCCFDFGSYNSKKMEIKAAFKKWFGYFYFMY